MTPLRVVVVGGGIAGLAAAHRLVELAQAEGRALDLVLLEAADRLGGTIRTEHVDGFLLEAGADSFISEKPWALALAERIGLGARLRRTDDRFRRTYVVRGGSAPPAAGRVPPPGPDPRVAGAGVGRLLLAREAPAGPRPDPAARPGRRGREPRKLRPAPARPRGARAGRPAPRRRDLHGGSRPPVARRDHAALPRARARAPELDPRPPPDGPGWRGRRGERGALEPLRHAGRRHGGAGRGARRAPSGRGGPALHAGGGRRARAGRLAGRPARRAADPRGRRRPCRAGSRDGDARRRGGPSAGRPARAGSRARPRRRSPWPIRGPRSAIPSTASASWCPGWRGARSSPAPSRA